MNYNVAGYCEILMNLKSNGYIFIDFSELKSRRKKCVLLRHDIDNDVQAAWEMAKIESELGIKATYFFMTRSPLYNLFSRHNDSLVRKILSMGHSLGLHYDQGYDEKRKIDAEESKQQIESECRYLEKAFDTKIAGVSFHQPSERLLSSSEFSLKTRVNTYDKMSLRGYKYFSDSNRSLNNNFMFEYIERSTLIDEDGNIQLLIHPMWWIYEQQAVTDVWNIVMENTLKYAMPQLLETERAFGLKRKISVS